LTVTLVAEADAFAVTFDEPDAAVTTYPVIGFPPSNAGALHDTTKPVWRPNTDVNNGAAGTCAGNGTTGFDAALNALEPAAFDADTFATYATPLHNPPTTPAELEPETDALNGPTQIVGGVTPLAGATEIA
jgi:hypothetical protein